MSFERLSLFSFFSPRSTFFPQEPSYLFYLTFSSFYLSGGRPLGRRIDFSCFFVNPRRFSSSSFLSCRSCFRVSIILLLLLPQVPDFRNRRNSSLAVLAWGRSWELGTFVNFYSSRFTITNQKMLQLVTIMIFNCSPSKRQATGQMTSTLWKSFKAGRTVGNNSGHKIETISLGTTEQLEQFVALTRHDV